MFTAAALQEKSVFSEPIRFKAEGLEAMKYYLGHSYIYNMFNPTYTM